MKHRIVTAAQMKEIERAGDAHGLPYLQMMENAGLAAYAELQKQFPHPGRLLVFCLTGLSHSLALLCIPGVVVFACNGMLTVLTTLFLSNSVDYGELKTGRREESVIFSMQTFVVKAASGVAVFLTGIGLDLIGLVGNTEETGPVAVQSAGTLLGLRLMMTVLPMLVLAGALVLFRRKFVLTDARAAEISAQLHGEETHHD